MQWGYPWIHRVDIRVSNAEPFSAANRSFRSFGSTSLIGGGLIAGENKKENMDVDLVVYITREPQHTPQNTIIPTILKSPTRYFSFWGTPQIIVENGFP